MGQSNEKVKVNNNQKKQTNSKKGIDNLTASDKFKIIVALSIIFILLFLIMYRNSKINEAFSEINSIKNEVSKIEKENNQLEVSIQSSLNLYNVEQAAKDLLGMQKLTNAQTIYISLPKKDYIETSVEEIEKEEKGFWSGITEKIKDIFK